MGIDDVVGVQVFDVPSAREVRRPPAITVVAKITFVAKKLHTGVSTGDYPIITVTEETAAGGKDPAQGSSGRIVASGTLGAGCPA